MKKLRKWITQLCHDALSAELADLAQQQAALRSELHKLKAHLQHHFPAGCCNKGE